MSLERGVDAFAGLSFTGVCPAAMAMRALGMKSERELATASR